MNTYFPQYVHRVKKDELAYSGMHAAYLLTVQHVYSLSKVYIPHTHMKSPSITNVCGFSSKHLRILTLMHLKYQHK